MDGKGSREGTQALSPAQMASEISFGSAKGLGVGLVPRGFLEKETKSTDRSRVSLMLAGEH